MRYRCDGEPVMASLDEPARIQPSMHIYCASAQPWGECRDELPRYPKLPG